MGSKSEDRKKAESRRELPEKLPLSQPPCKKKQSNSGDCYSVTFCVVGYRLAEQLYILGL